jgi:hypothetical protein
MSHNHGKIISADRPRGLGDFLNEAFVFYGCNLLRVVALVALPSAVYLSLGYIAARTIFQLPGGPIFRGIPVLLALVIVSIPILAVVQGLIAYAVMQGRMGKNISIPGAFRFLRPKLWPLLGARLASGLIILGIAALAAGVLYLMAAAGVTSLGLVFAIILGCVGIYFYITWLFVEHAVLVEKCSVKSALRSSERWAKGRRWSLLWTMVAFHIVAMLFSLAPSPLDVVGWNGAIGIIVMPLYAIAATLLYLDSRLRKEGFKTKDLVRVLEGA